MSCWLGRPSFGSFLGRSRKERPRGGYRSKIKVPKALKKLCSSLKRAISAQENFITCSKTFTASGLINE
ncbi:hypothetical protein CSQ88_01425 [Iodobacter sp. BJB302]|nr:hypothetical protein CSQ88_01425 [Iodobacter sp. BJB302]